MPPIAYLLHLPRMLMQKMEQDAFTRTNTSILSESQAHISNAILFLLVILHSDVIKFKRNIQPNGRYISL